MRLWLALIMALLIQAATVCQSFAQFPVQSEEVRAISPEEKLESAAIAAYATTAQTAVQTAWRAKVNVKDKISAIRIKGVVDATGKIVTVKILKASDSEKQNRFATDFVSSLPLPSLPGSLKSLELFFILVSDGRMEMCEFSQTQEAGVYLMNQVFKTVGAGPIGNSPAAAPGGVATSDPGLAPYLLKVQQRLKLGWAQTKSVDDKNVVVTFQIEKSGHTSALRILESSGDPQADKAALTVVRNASPLPPPPPGAPDPINLQFRFDHPLKTDL